MRIVFALVFALSACQMTDDAADRMNLEYQVGEQLMNDCNIRQERCSEWLAFKREWEADVNYLTTFERSLAAHKARVASGQAV